MTDGARRPGQRFSGADSSWWHMEERTNQMAITAVLVLDGPLDPDQLRDLFGRRLLRHARFRQRVTEPGGLGMPRWVDEPVIDLDRHLERVRLPDGAGQAELEAVVGREMSRPLDYDRPLWRVLCVDGYQGGSVLVVRVHHCIADGLALVRILLTLEDDDPDADASYARYLHTPQEGGLLAHGLDIGLRTVGSLGRLVGMRPDPGSSLRGQLGPEKRAAWSRPLGLQTLRSAAREAGGTLNDVLLSTIAGGLGTFLGRNGDAPSRSIRAVVPVNLRRPAEKDTLGNRFGLVFAPLPIWIPDPVERLEAVHRGMRRLKRSPEAGVVFGLLEFFGRTPRRALDVAVRFLGSKASLVLTNVPGPKKRVRFCGRELVGLVAWVPQSGKLGIGVSLISYHDQIRLAVASDAALVPEPEALVDAFHDAAAQLLDALHVTDRSESPA